MPVDIYWRIAMEGDQKSLYEPGSTRGGFADHLSGGLAPGRNRGAADGFTHADYMAEVVRASEESGFVGGLLPSFAHTDDPWATAASLAAETRGYRFMVAFQPGFLHPVQAARMSATLQKATGGRLVYNIISGGGGPQQLWWGDTTGHDDRYARTSEFLDVLKGVWTGEGTFQHEGRFYRVADGGLPAALAGQPFPEIFFSGSSPAAIQAAGRHADYYLSWLEPFEALAEKFAAVRARSPRPPKFAVRIDILARPTEQEAWDVIRRGWAGLPAEAEREGGDSVGWRRSQDFTAGADGSFRALQVAPNLWGGFHRLRPGPAFGLVGDYRQVADRLEELVALGVDAFILAGVPHLEEARRVGRHVLPLLKGNPR
ncbi:LLM class flavin-dependent oxidoreductase [Catenulispora sp. NF23]|uniref:LLM class flavin-dependent oxidoreductase n=1 Tax=Catenulispora pinistramenti TaxID=2705254 RepID=A0ABS5L1B9_9ACTN|nr:LLM class flavin-dependent oxidoreductase [Catenulispora pinistramenti]MBS2535780.1 LLM class flavin-dependent oxidoreductase [Catenulispora pinistramenti]MBS2552127.1 LLM class flavin-dependent oxidoreductase [Catenulispora pinistramenti]